VVATGPARPPGRYNTLVHIVAAAGPGRVASRAGAAVASCTNTLSGCQNNKAARVRRDCWHTHTGPDTPYMSLRSYPGCCGRSRDRKDCWHTRPGPGTPYMSLWSYLECCGRSRVRRDCWHTHPGPGTPYMSLWSYLWCCGRSRLRRDCWHTRPGPDTPYMICGLT
jgi:hypothetical protein